MFLTNPMHAIRIILLCIASAIVYGIAHDLVTARVSIEYFTIGHPRVLQTDSPTVLAIIWGVAATWWVGLMLGVSLALTSRMGARPKLIAKSHVRPIVLLLIAMAICAAIAGIIGFNFARTGTVTLIGRLAANVPEEKHVPFIAALWAHTASYLVGLSGGIILCVHAWRRRRSG